MFPLSKKWKLSVGSNIELVQLYITLISGKSIIISCISTNHCEHEVIKKY